MDHAIKKCLAKSADERWQSASDLASELKWVADAGSQAGLQVAPITYRKPWQRKAGTVASVLASVAIVFAAALVSAKFLSKTSTTSTPVVRFDIPLTVAQSSAFSFLTLDRGVTISPDGKRLIFRLLEGSTVKLFLRNLNATESAAISGTEGALYAFFSPDGQAVAFFSAGKLKKVSLGGGTPSVICDAPNLQGSGYWGADGNIYFSVGTAPGLWRVAAEGGTPQKVGAPPADAMAEFSPVLLPGGEATLEAVWDGKSFDSWRIETMRVGTGERHTVLSNGFSPRFVSPGYLLFVRDDNVFAVAFDAKRLEARGTPVSVVEGVVNSTPYGVAQFDVSNNGDLVYVGGSGALHNHLVWRERDGRAHEIALPLNTYQAPRISPDGKDVALTVRNPNADIWIYNIARETLRRVSFAPGENEVAAWSPDGKRIAYASNSRGQLSWVAADGSTGEETLAPMGSHVHIGSWSRDGKIMVYEAFSRTTNRGVWILPLEGDRKPYCYICNNFDNRLPALSPDGHWLAYQSNESGQPEIYVKEFPGPGGKTQISREGGTFPVWAKNGLELFYRNNEKQMVTSISTKGGFIAGNPRVLFENPGWAWMAGPPYDWTPDGKRMIAVEVGKETIASPLHVVVNWKSELVERLAAQR
jgi:Tol biopolymer transport system component